MSRKIPSRFCFYQFLVACFLCMIMSGSICTDCLFQSEVSLFFILQHGCPAYGFNERLSLLSAFCHMEACLHITSFQCYANVESLNVWLRMHHVPNCQIKTKCEESVSLPIKDKLKRCLSEFGGFGVIAARNSITDWSLVFCCYSFCEQINT